MFDQQAFLKRILFSILDRAEDATTLIDNMREGRYKRRPRFGVASPSACRHNARTAPAPKAIQNWYWYAAEDAERALDWADEWAVK